MPPHDTPFTRAQLGLPPPPAPGRARIHILAVTALALMGAHGLGVIAGRVAYREAEYTFVQQVFQLRQQFAGQQVDAFRATLQNLQQRRAALTGNLTVRYAMSRALDMAADLLPDNAWRHRQDARDELRAALHLLGRDGVRLEGTGAPDFLRLAEAADALLRQADVSYAVPSALLKYARPVDGVTADRAMGAWTMESAYANVLMALNENAEALAALDRADAWLAFFEADAHWTEHKRWAVNNRAYLLATASEKEVFHPREALRLATGMMRLPIRSPVPLPSAHGEGGASRDGGSTVHRPATAESALVDTLAAAYAANGRWADAYRTQRMALGLSDDPAELAPLLHLYRRIVAAGGATAAANNDSVDAPDTEGGERESGPEGYIIIPRPKNSVMDV